MASHGKKRHTKRLAVQRVLQVHKKKHLWIKSTRPGPHAKESAIPIVILLRDLMGVCSTTKEAKKIIHNKQLIVDGKAVRDVDFQVGLMDVLSLKNDGSFVIINKGGKLVAVETKSTDHKLCKIVGKRTVAGGKTQLTLHDGRSVVVPDGKPYSPGDTLKIAIPKNSISGHLKLEKGSRCYVFRGRHAGAVGSLVDIHVFSGITPSNARIVDESGTEVTTLKDYVFVVDKEFKI